jgi:transcriptional regulator with XRE-family HTH domain
MRTKADHRKDDQEKYVEIGARLRNARLKAGLSQEETAKFLGLTFQQVQKYEKGANRVPIVTALRLCAYFGVEPAWLFGYEEGQEDKEPEPMMLTKRGIELIRLSANLNDNQIAAMVVVAKQFNNMNGEETNGTN